ncbi:MAG: hypothetical protein WC791_00795 [Candidatus Paceibacterota bacterium]
MTLPILIALNVAIIILAEFVGGGTLFAESGLAYIIAVLFVILIAVRVLADYAYGDYILKGFMKIQLTFLMLLGLVQLYEYVGLNIFLIRPDVVQLTVEASYFVWILSAFLSLAFVFRIYYNKSQAIMVALWAFFALCIVGLIAPSISPAVVSWFPVWFPKLILTGITVAGVVGILALRRLREIMPVFTEFSHYSIPATILLILTGFSEYFEAYEVLQDFGISLIQNVYISHFFVYVALSLLLIGFGKLQKPKGIYEDM